jgi:hypothetical protein
MESGPIILPYGVPMMYKSQHGTLMLAATNIVFGKFPDDLGKEQRGWTAALSMMIGNDRETIKAFKVHAGKSIQFDKFTVNVQRIESSRFGMVVMAEIYPEK